MNAQNHDDHPPEDQPPEVMPPPREEQPLEAIPTPEEGLSKTSPPPRRFKLTRQFAAGFLGWYLVNSLFYLQNMDQESLTICGGLLFPVNAGVLVLLSIKRPQIGQGMLSALAVNMVVSLFLGLWTNAFCFLPFFAR